MTEYQWIIKINGIKQTGGFCFDRDEAISEAGRYFVQYSEEDFEKITLEIKVKNKRLDG